MLPADSRSNPNNIFIIFSNTSTKPSLPFVMPISYHDMTTPLQTFHPFLSVVITCSLHFGVPSGDQLYLVILNHPRNPDVPPLLQARGCPMIMALQAKVSLRHLHPLSRSQHQPQFQFWSLSQQLPRLHQLLLLAQSLQFSPLSLLSHVVQNEPFDPLGSR